MQDLPIIREENIRLIVSSAPAAYAENTLSHDRCIEAGRSILAAMQQGATDDLDQQAAAYIEKARKTLRKMNEKRSSLTKLFDEIRSVFTVLENDIDPSKAGTVPAQIQAERNRFAAKKREEAMARQREEMRRQQEQQLRTDYFNQCQSYYRQAYAVCLRNDVNYLTDLLRATTLTNIDDHESILRKTRCDLPGSFVRDAVASMPINADIAECTQIRTDAMQAIIEELKHDYTSNITATRDNILSVLPSKREQLQLAAKADEEEAAHIARQMQEADMQRAAEQQRKLAEQQQQQQAAAEMRAAAQQAEDLFSQAAAATPAYQPKTNVRLRLTPLNAEAFPEILALWWKYEGSRLPIDELSKIFKKQVSFAEKLANDKARPELIKSEHIAYEEEVKAK